MSLLTGKYPIIVKLVQLLNCTSILFQSRWSHVSEKPLSCDRCSMTFTSKSQFAVHIRTHSMGQNYECNVCGRTFIRDSYLIRHHNRVHRDNRTTANSIAVINSVAAGHTEILVDYDSSVGAASQQQQQVCDLR